MLRSCVVPAAKADRKESNLVKATASRYLNNRMDGVRTRTDLDTNRLGHGERGAVRDRDARGRSFDNPIYLDARWRCDLDRSG